MRKHSRKIDTTITLPRDLPQDPSSAIAMKAHEDDAEEARKEPKRAEPLERPKRTIKRPEKLNDYVCG